MMTEDLKYLIEIRYGRMKIRFEFSILRNEMIKSRLKLGFLNHHEMLFTKLFSKLLNYLTFFFFTSSYYSKIGYYLY